MPKRILILDANPHAGSLCGALADSYSAAAEVNAEVQYFQLSAMEFNPNLAEGYHAEQPLEPVLKNFQAALANADHLVIVAPLWWGGVPAKCKGLLDRTLLPGFAFKYVSGEEEPVPLLEGKTLRLMVTMDTPPEYFENLAHMPLVQQLGAWVFQLCGFQPAEVSLFGPVIHSMEQQRQAWLEQSRGLGSDLC